MDEIICDVKWDEIKVSPFQPRKNFAQEELKELASSIQSVGLIQPPVVRKIVSGGKLLYYELIAGERRWRAARLAGLDSLKVIVRETTDETAAKITLIENIQRVNLDPIELALSLQKLIDTFGMKQEQVAQEVGKKRSTVANYLRLLSLSPLIQSSLSQGAITMGHAKAILSLETLKLRQMLHDKIIASKLTVRQAEEESLKLANRTAKKAKDVHVLDLEEQLQHALGTKVSIESGAEGKGKIIIHYYALADIERLCDALNATSKNH